MLFVLRLTERFVKQIDADDSFEIAILYVLSGEKLFYTEDIHHLCLKCVGAFLGRIWKGSTSPPAETWLTVYRRFETNTGA